MIPSWSGAATLTTPGPDLSFNTGGASDDLYLDPDQCDYQVDTRVEAQDAPRAHGSIKFPTLFGAGHLKLAGRLKPVTDTAAARDAMAASLYAAGIALSNGGLGTFSCPHGTYTVELEMFPVVTGGFRKSFVIVLFAANPLGG